MPQGQGRTGYGAKPLFAHTDNPNRFNYRPPKRDYAEILAEYCNGVINGTVPSCIWVKAAVHRFIDLTKDPRYQYRHGRVEKIARFVECMPHVQGEWANRRELITLHPYQLFILANVYGLYIGDSQDRLIQHSLTMVARKNAKSSITAPLCIAHITVMNEAGAQVYATATTRDQARIVFDISKQMVSKSPDLAAHYGLKVQQHTIVNSDFGRIMPLSSDATTLDGLNPTFVSVDEFHAHKDSRVIDVMKSASGARRNCLIWAISTAGFNQEGPCYSYVTNGRAVLNRYVRKYELGEVSGTVSPSEQDHYFYIEYTLDKEDDPFDPLVWSKANPMLGVSVYPKSIHVLSDSAKAKPEDMSNFLTKSMNVWVNASTAWMNLIKWDQCCIPPAINTLRSKDPADRWTFVDVNGNRLDSDAGVDMDSCDIFMGFDLASRVDLASIALLMRVPAGTNGVMEDKVYVKSISFCPWDTITKNSIYARWHEQGYIIATPGSEISFEEIMREILRICSMYHVKDIGYDPYESVYMVQQLKLTHGLSVPMTAVQAGARGHSEAMKEIEGAVYSKRLQHYGDRVLDWAVSNVVAKVDSNFNVAPTKESNDKKIDPVVAMILAFNRLIALPLRKSYWNDPDAVF